MKMKFIFWNINKKPLVDEIAELIDESKCDVCAFAEADQNTIDKVITGLKEKYKINCSSYSPPGCDRIKIIAIEDIKIDLLNQNKYFSLIKLKSKKRDLIVGFVHFPSRLHAPLDVIGRVCAELRRKVVEEEECWGIHDSMLMGDFNVNPFDMPMISFRDLGATNGLDCSQRGNVCSYGESNKLFYNPMWTLYASYKARPGGYRYLNTPHHVLTWHFLDQVIIRPSLIDYFNFDSLMLVRKTKNFDYLNKNQIPKTSDHLPLMCEIEI